MPLLSLQAPAVEVRDREAKLGDGRRYREVLTDIDVYGYAFVVGLLLAGSAVLFDAALGASSLGELATNGAGAVILGVFVVVLLDQFACHLLASHECVHCKTETERWEVEEGSE